MNTPSQINTAPQTVYLKDYRICDFRVISVHLEVDLHEDTTSVGARLELERHPDATYPESPLVLNGEAMLLESVTLDGELLQASDYVCTPETLTIAQVPQRFVVETRVSIKPQDNTQLSGLYKSSGNFCTQCESQGFRRITYFFDRPDVMTRFTTKITADKSRYPVLLSNGNLLGAGEGEAGRHWVIWEDPSLKPCYLFALVAGDYDHLSGHLTTCSGREVELRVYTEKGKVEQAHFAMESLKQSMRWDEQAYGREYDLDIYMIVTVSDFNFGAMENKGLNIFNNKYILADPKTATDDDYSHVEGVVGHEYFHNWSGNRVTCRDWFQISLKEGFTVFREHQFRSDRTSALIQRIKEVRTLRTAQFAEDGGPMAHPVRPDSYVEIGNFYTVTVYNKGAEVIRMLHTFLGATLFHQGADLYFKRHDGQAVTTEDFVQVMEDVSGRDFTLFKRWYNQAGTPVLMVTDAYHAEQQTYTLTVTQSCPPTRGQPVKEPFYLPLSIGLLDREGRELPLQLAGEAQAPVETTRVLTIFEATHTFEFINISAPPVPSLLRGFSAPVKLDYEATEEDLAFLLEHDPDLFNRWDAGQTLTRKRMLALVNDLQEDREWVLSPVFVAVFARLLDHPALDKGVLAQLLMLPSENRLIECMEVADIDAIHSVRQFIKRELATALKTSLWAMYKANASDKPYAFTVEEVNRRALRNVCLGYLIELQDPEVHQAALAQFTRADNMTDKLAALGALNQVEGPIRQQALSDFYAEYQDNALVMDKWFSLQAIASLPGALERVKALMEHPLFDIKNPNKVRALVGAFGHGNPVHFHRKDGAGYTFLADQVLAVDSLNPHIAAFLAGLLSRWRKFDTARQALMRAELDRIAAAPDLSRNVYEVVSKSQ